MTGPLTLLALANLLAAWNSIGVVRGWWLAAALLVVADRVRDLFRTSSQRWSG